MRAARAPCPVPTVLRLDGFDFRIYTEDHAPAHVHVFVGRFEARIAIGDATVAPFAIDPGGMSTREVRDAIRIVEVHQAVFLGIWRTYHG